MKSIKFFESFKTFDFASYALWLVPSVLIYFIASRVFQNHFTFWNFEMVDAYPGFPILPEPFEIPLYFLSYAVIPLLALVFYSLRNSKVFQYVAGTAVLAGIVYASRLVFRVHLPSWAFATGYFQRRSLWHLAWLLFTKRIYIVRLSFLAAIFAFSVVFWRQSKTLWLQTLNQSPRLKKIVPYFFVFLALIVFHPNFPSAEGYTNMVVSPVDLMLRGQPLLYETVGIYGILNTYLVAAIMKFLLPISYQAFSVILMVLYFTFFVLVYRTLKNWMNSDLFALVGTWLAVVVNFFLLTDPYLTPYDFPGQTVYRQGFYIVLAWLISRYVKFPSTGKRQLLLFFSALALFWNVDTGIYVNIAVFATLGYDVHIRVARFWPKLRKILIAGLEQAGYIAIVFGVIGGLNRLLYHQWPKWRFVWLVLTGFEQGFGKLPMPKVGLFEIFVLVYSGFAVWIATGLWRRRPEHLLTVFFTVYGIFALTYYVGNSAWSYLNATSLSMLLLLWSAFYRYFAFSDQKTWKRFMSAALGAFLAFFATLSLAKLPVVFAYRDYSKISLTAIAPKDQQIYEDARYIKEHYSEEAIPLFHPDDGKLLLMAGKINFFYSTQNGQKLYRVYDDYQIVFHSQVKALTEQLAASQPEHVFLYKNYDVRIADLENFAKQHYELEKTLNTLKIYRLKGF